jgi:hypothetical protein
VLRSDGRRQRAARLEDLEGLRSALYGCATRRADAWFELVDALLVTERLVSLPHLSLEPVYRRGHGSLYAALRHGQVQAARLREVLAAHLPAGPPVFAVDATVWPRCDAECSPGRGFYYHPSRHSAGQPIVAGWCYQLLVGLEFARDSWTAPVDVRRLAPDDSINLVAAGQVRGLLDRLPIRQQVPLVVFDGGFDPVQLQVELAGAAVQVLVRIRSDRNFYAAGHPRRDGRPGRPARHGAKLSLADPATWPAPTASWAEADPQYGQVTVTAWGGLHPKQRTYRDAGGYLRIVAGTLVRVHVARLPGRARAPKTLWLWWAGPAGAAPDLALVWRAYVRRFDIEIVCTQVTKPRLGAAGRGWDHVADLHLAVDHHHPVDQQLHQLAALLEAGLAQAHAELLQHLGHGLGDRADLDQPLALGGDLPLAGQQVGLLPGKALVLALEGGQVDHLGQVGLQQPPALAGNARPDAAQARLPAAELLRHPGAAVGALQRLGDQVRLLEDRAQVRPDQLVELGGGDEPRRAAAGAAGADLRHLAAAAVIPVAGVGGSAGDAAAAQPADPAADQPAQQVGVGGAAPRGPLVGGQPPGDQVELLGRHQRGDRHGDPLLGWVCPGAHPRPTGSSADFRRRAECVRSRPLAAWPL